MDGETLTPLQFQNDALTWIGVLVVVILAAIGAVGKIAVEARAVIATLKERQDRQGQIQQTLLLNTPAPTQTAPAAPVIVNNTDSGDVMTGTPTPGGSTQGTPLGALTPTPNSTPAPAPLTTVAPPETLPDADAAIHAREVQAPSE